MSVVLLLPVVTGRVKYGASVSAADTEEDDVGTPGAIGAGAVSTGALQ